MRREHVHLVDEVHLVAAAGRRVLHVVEQLARVVDLGPRRRVDFDEVNETSAVDFPAGPAHAARLRSNAGLAVQTLSEDSGDRGLADAAGPGKEKRVMDAPGLERIDQCPADMLLPDQLGKFLGAPFTRQRGIAHE